MNGKKNVIISALVIVFIIAIIALPKITTVKTQKMNELNYNITLNEDGSMNVTETWDIDIKNTGTLFRAFEDLTKYPITNIEVIDLTTNDRLTNINRSMEQVPEGQ